MDYIKIPNSREEHRICSGVLGAAGAVLGKGLAKGAAAVGKGALEFGKSFTKELVGEFKKSAEVGAVAKRLNIKPDAVKQEPKIQAVLEAAKKHLDSTVKVEMGHEGNTAILKIGSQKVNYKTAEEALNKALEYRDAFTKAALEKNGFNLQELGLVTPNLDVSVPIPSSRRVTSSRVTRIY